MSSDKINERFKLATALVNYDIDNKLETHLDPYFLFQEYQSMGLTYLRELVEEIKLKNQNMKELFNKYLTPVQYNKICKYWSYINKTKYELEHFDYSKYKYYQEYSDDEEIISEYIEYNKELDIQIEMLRAKLTYYETEYEKYINSIGFELSNRTYDEILFNLLNDGIVLN